MPACDGRPNEPCPDQKCDKTVRPSQGELFLCEACERFRFPYIYTMDSRKQQSSTRAVKNPDGGSNIRTTSTASDSGTRQQMADVGAAAGVDKNAQSSDVRGDVVSNNKLLVNELLTYISYYRDRSSVDNLRRVVLGFYPATDISEAKRMLIGEFKTKIGVSSLLVDRRNTTTRPAHEAEVDDIFGLIEMLDIQNSFHTCVFVAADLDKVPKYGPEELNMCTIVDRQARMENTLQNVTDNVEKLLSVQSTPINSIPNNIAQTLKDDIQQKLDVFTSAVNSRLDHLNAVCLKLSEKTSSNSGSNSLGDQRRSTADTSANIVIFGIKEHRDAAVWRRQVDDALKHVAGRPVDIADVFRVGGTFKENRTRPVLVKLRTVWDRRIVLSNAAKLKDYIGRLYIAPDEPLEVRRKRVFESIKYRAQRDGKVVTINGDVLCIDGVDVFSLKNGDLRK